MVKDHFQYSKRKCVYILVYFFRGRCRHERKKFLQQLSHSKITSGRLGHYNIFYERELWEWREMQRTGELVPDLMI